MKKKRSQSGAPDAALCESLTDDAAIADDTSGNNAAGVGADALLVKRCVAGEVSAWEQLYGQCHEPLLVSIRVMLGRTSNDANLVDEIAARVWYALVANDGEVLARFNPKRGARLGTFLRLMAKDEIARHFRAEVRRRARELSVLRERTTRHEKDHDHHGSALTEFLGTLTPQERAFCGDYLLAGATSGADGTSHSAANIWQLKHRIYLRLRQFLDAGL